MPNEIVEREQDALQVGTLIERVALDPNFNVDKLKALFELRNSDQDRHAKREYNAAFAAMKPHLPLVIRLHDNTQTKSKYAKIEDINKVIDPILAEYGFATSMKVISQTDTTVTGRVELIHKGGHMEYTDITMPIDDRGIAGTVNKTKPHAISATIMYIRRVGECALLNISTGNDTDGNQPSDYITIEQAADIDTRARVLGEKGHANLLAHHKVKMATEIPANQYKKVLASLTTMEAAFADRKTKAAK